MDSPICTYSVIYAYNDRCNAILDFDRSGVGAESDDTCVQCHMMLITWSLGDSNRWRQRRSAFTINMDEVLCLPELLTIIFSFSLTSNYKGFHSCRQASTNPQVYVFWRSVVISTSENRHCRRWSRYMLNLYERPYGRKMVFWLSSPRRLIRPPCPTCNWNGWRIWYNLIRRLLLSTQLIHNIHCYLPFAASEGHKTHVFHHH